MRRKRSIGRDENSNRNIGLTAFSHHDTVCTSDPGLLPRWRCPSGAQLMSRRAVCARLEACSLPCCCRRRAALLSEDSEFAARRSARQTTLMSRKSSSSSSRCSRSFPGASFSTSAGRFGASTRQTAQFLDVFRRSNKFSEVQAVCRSLGESPLVGLFQAGYAELTAQLRQSGHGGRPPEPIHEPAAGRPTLKSLTAVDRALMRASVVEVNKLEPGFRFWRRRRASRRSSGCSARCGAS